MRTDNNLIGFLNGSEYSIYEGSRTAEEIESFKQGIIAWLNTNPRTEAEIKDNVIKTAARINQDWSAAGIPADYTYEIYSAFRSPEDQTATFIQGWEAAIKSYHPLGQAADIHVFKNGSRIKGAEMKDFYNQYISGKFLEYTKLYDWGFHTHWTRDIAIKLTFAGIVLAAAILYIIFSKKK
jgi:hypothetical protein